MKKTLLSVVLCVALVVTAMGSMLAMPASAASGVDFLVSGAATPNAEGLDYKVEGGVFTFNASAAGQEVAFVVEDAPNLNNFPYLELEITSTAKWDACVYDPNTVKDGAAKWIFCAGDFCFDFGSSAADQPIPAGTYTVKIDLLGAYRWNNTVHPDMVAKSITFIAKEAGTITVTKAQITDGVTEVNLDTRGDQSDAKWDASKTVNLIAGDAISVPAESNGKTSDVKVTKNSDGSVTFGNTNGLWPAAVYDFQANPVKINGTAALNIDFNVAANCKTTIFLFMGDMNNGGSTHDNYGNNTYVWIADLGVAEQVMAPAELGVGHYSGTIFLEDIYKKTIGDPEKAELLKDSEGNFVINSIKIFATSAGDTVEANAVTVNKMELVALEENATLPPTTDPAQKTTTTTLGAATTGANATTVNKGGSTGGNSASTGDASQALLFVVVAAAAASVVTVSAVSKKAKSR